jgi:homoserine dehydrogenase
VIVELTGTTTEASALANAALRQGRHFVTANKALLATEGDQLAALAQEHGVTIRHSAAVGGALPALETIERARGTGKIKSFSGILNGTTNFILDRIAEGEDLSTAVAAAQQAGYAEANPLLDLNGTDTTHKLILLARKAFDVKLGFDEVDRIGIENIDPVWVQKAQQRGYVVRLVAECLASPSGIKTTVKPIEIPESHPFAQVRGAGNCLVVQPDTGEALVVYAQGAGRWPTTESVIADLLDIRTECTQQELEVAVA